MISILESRFTELVQEPTRDWSQAFELAFKLLEQHPGENLSIPQGEYFTGPWSLPSFSHIHLEKGAIIRFLPDFSLYKPVWTRWEGVECYGLHPLIFCNEKEQIVITGDGIFDGSGQAWWQVYRDIRSSGRRIPETELELKLASLIPGFQQQPSGGGGREFQFLRPPLLQIWKSHNISVQGVTLQNSPFWNTHPVFSTHITFSGVTFRNPANAPNTDGLDIDSCDQVRVTDCVFDVGDDCLAIKSGAGADGLRVNIPSKHIFVENCTMLAGHGGIVIGSETAGGVEDVVVQGCKMMNNDRAIRIKTRRGRGGRIQHLLFKDISIQGGLCPVVMNSYYHCGADPKDPVLFDLNPRQVQADTPSIESITLENIQAYGVKSSAGFFAGLPERPIEGLQITNLSVTLAQEDQRVPTDQSAMYAGLPATQDRGVRILFCKNPILENLDIRE